MDEIVSIFIQESREQLTAMETALLELEANPSDSDRINAIFRAAHTIKGAAGVIECNYIVEFTHVVENALDKLRNGEISVSADLVALLLSCNDHIGTLVSVLENNQEAPDPECKASGDHLLERLQKDFLNATEAVETAAQARQTVQEAAKPPHSDGGVVVGADSCP